MTRVLNPVRTEPHPKNSIHQQFERENNFFPPFLAKRLKKAIEKEKPPTYMSYVANLEEVGPERCQKSVK